MEQTLLDPSWTIYKGICKTFSVPFKEFISNKELSLETTSTFFRVCVPMFNLVSALRYSHLPLFHDREMRDASARPNRRY